MSTIIDAPAPWDLTGRAYICALRPAAQILDQHSFVPESLAGRRRGGPSLLMFVDYAESPVGPYHELLFIPGLYAFEDGRKHLSISRIFVSTEDSVVNGQRNWGIPKDTAQFSVRDDGNTTRVTVSKDGAVFAELEFAAFGPPLPVPHGLIPASWRTLAQHHEGRTYVYQPNAGGTARLARTRAMRFDPAQFPDLAQARVLATLNLRRFAMTFPAAEVFTPDEVHPVST